MRDTFMTLLIVFLVIGGWAAIILKDLGHSKGNWVHGIAAAVFALLLI